MRTAPAYSVGIYKSTQKVSVFSQFPPVAQIRHCTTATVDAATAPMIQSEPISMKSITVLTTTSSGMINFTTIQTFLLVWVIRFVARRGVTPKAYLLGMIKEMV